MGMGGAIGMGLFMGSERSCLVWHLVILIYMIIGLSCISSCGPWASCCINLNFKSSRTLPVRIWGRARRFFLAGPTGLTERGGGRDAVVVGGSSSTGSQCAGLDAAIGMMLTLFA